MKGKYTKILQDCINIAEEREESYGDILTNFTEIQTILLCNFKIELSIEEIANVFIAIKIARNKHKHSEDNIKDLINYFAILQYLHEK